MIITFCGHSDYIASAEDEQKILSILSEKIGDQNAELFLGGYGAFDAFAKKCGSSHRIWKDKPWSPYLSKCSHESIKSNHLAL